MFIDTLVGLGAIVAGAALFILVCLVSLVSGFIQAFRRADPQPRPPRRGRRLAWVLTAIFGFGFVAALAEWHGGFAAASIIACSFAVRWLVNDAMRRRRAERAAIAARTDRQNAAWWAGDANRGVFGNLPDDTPTERLW